MQLEVRKQRKKHKPASKKGKATRKKNLINHDPKHLEADR